MKIKGKKLTIAILLLVVLSIISITIFQNKGLNKIADVDEEKIEAATITTNSEWDYWEYEGMATLTKYKIIDATSVEIPSVIDGYPVTRIGGSGKVFEGCSNISNITIPDSITTIWSQAFEECSKLTSINIPDSVTSISWNAFSGCTSLTNVNIPNSVTSIEGSAFSGCSSLISVQLPNTLTSIGSHAFFECTKLTSINIPNGISILSSGIFDGCNGLTNMIIPDNVTSIENSVFNGCIGLTSVQLPNTLTSIGNNAFKGCTKLTSINIPNGIVKISSGIFDGCIELENIIIPDSVTSIENSAFKGCSSLTNIQLSNTLANIEYSAFYNCIGLTNISIPDSVTNIKATAFYGCSALTDITIPTNIKNVATDAFNNCDNLTKVKIPYEIRNVFKSCKNLRTIEIIDEIESIDNSAFSNWTNITNIIMPDSVINIGDRAFYNCSALETIKISSNLTSIGEYAFNGCKKLTSIEIPDKVTNIYRLAFFGCEALTNIIIPDSVTSIGDYAFNNCNGLINVTMPGSFIDEGSWVFLGCDNLTDIKISGNKADIDLKCIREINNLRNVEILQGVTSIGANVFENCSSLINVVIPNSVTSIENYAFNRCTSLKSITIPDSVTSIGDFTFSNCTSLTGIEIPNSVTNIGQNAFYNCIGLTNIEIPDSVTNIGQNVVYGCKNIVNAKIPYILKDELKRNENIQIEIVDKIEKIDDNAFAGFRCSNIILPDSVKNIGNSAFNGCYELTNIIIPEGVTMIGDSAFQGCDALSNIEIPNTVTTIGKRAFRNCSGLTNITIPSGVSNIDFETFYGCNSLESVTIPNSITSIGGSVFAGCTSLTDIEIPNSVTNIGEDAFNGCTSLTSIEIPNGVTSIEMRTFNGCTSLTNVQIPSSVTNIKNAAFANCTSLGNITIPNSVTSIGYDVFYRCTSLTDIEVPDSVTSISAAFEGCSALTSIEIPNGVTSIVDNTFKRCSALKSIEIPNSVTSIGNDIFNGCTSLENIKMSENVTSIGNNAFKDCSALKSIEIPNGVTSIGSNTFSMCTSLESITIPDSVTSIGDFAFGGCTSLKDIEIPNGVTSIGSNTFSMCTSLESITIPDSVTSIGSYAFYQCNSLTKIEIPDSVTEIGANTFAGCENLTIKCSKNSVAYQYVVDNNMQYEVAIEDMNYHESETGGIVIDKIEESENSKVEIPSQLEGNPPKVITEIDSGIFVGKENIKTVVIPDSITKIAEDAFPENTQITIECNTGSYAEQYAKEHNMNYELLDKIIAKISIKILPNKVNYLKEDTELNLEGGILLLTYTDDTTSPISIEKNGVEVSGFTAGVVGGQTINVVYKENETTFKVNVIEVQNHETETGGLVVDKIEKGGNEETKVEVPTEINGKPVTEIGSGALEGGEITTIVIPESVTKIAEDAFPENAEITLEVKSGTYAEQYAKEHDMNYEYTDKIISEISTKKLPNKIKYQKEDAEINLEGGRLLLTYTDNTTSPISMRKEGIITSGFIVGQKGKQIINIEYKQKQTTFEIEVTGMKYEENGSGEVIINKIQNTNKEDGSIETKVEVPEEVNGKPVTEIGSGALEGEGITTVVIPESITKIAEDAFPENTDVTLEIKSGTYAEQYAKEHNMNYEYTDKIISEISMETLPSKIKYAKEDTELNLTGGRVLLTYTDETTSPISIKKEGINVSGFEAGKVGNQSITVEYKERETSFQIKVVDNIKNHETETGGIAIDKIEQDKTEGEEGKNEEAKVEVPTEINGKPVTEIGSGALEVNDQITTIVIPESVTKIAEDAFPENTEITLEIKSGSYAEQYAKEHDINYELTNKTIKEISMKTLPNKIKYAKEDTELNLTGGRILLTYTDDTASPISIKKEGINVSGFEVGRVGNQTITVTYKEKETSFQIKVVDNIKNHESETGGVVIDKIEQDKSEGEEAKVEVPTEINGKPVTEIGSGALEVNNQITTIVIPESVTKIAEDAFPENTEITLEVKSGTYAEQYAKEHNMNYEYTDKIIVGISIETLPNKMKYQEKDTEINLVGGRLLLTYTDNTTSPISMKKEGITTSGFISGQKGKQIISIEYKQKQVTFEIEVTGAKYEENESGGVTINKVEQNSTGTDNDTKETKVEIPSEINGKPVTEIGSGVLDGEKITTVVIPESVIKIAEDAFPKNAEITLEIKSGSYAEQYAKKHDMNYELTDKKITSISIKTLPNVIEYVKEETKLDLTGGRLLLTYTDNTTSPISMKKEGITISGFIVGKEGKQTINVTYKEKQTSFEINVIGEKGLIEKGDMNLDGKVDATDLLLVKRHIIAGSNLEWILKEEKFKAGDINDDGKIDATDLLLVKRKILSSKV